MKIIFAFALPVWLAAAVFANPALHGTWSAPNVQGRPLKVDFSSDGSGKINDAPMRWQAVGGTLFIQQNGQVASYGFKVDGDKLHVSGGDLAQPATLTKGAAAASGNGQELVGKWCDVRSMSNYQGGSSSMACAASVMVARSPSSTLPVWAAATVRVRAIVSPQVIAFR